MQQQQHGANKLAAGPSARSERLLVCGVISAGVRPLQMNYA